MFYHLRYTPYELSSDTSALTNLCTRYIVAREEHRKDGSPCEKHYHIWMDIDRSLDVVRTYIRKLLKIPKSGMGKNNKYYMLKEWDEKIEYIIKQGKIESSKGFSAEELVPRKYQGSTLTLDEKAKDSPLSVSRDKENLNSTWKELLCESMLWEKLNKKKIELEDAHKIIVKNCLKKMQPLPHPANRKRWARSLVLYSKLDWAPEEAQDTLNKVVDEEHVEFMVENEVHINRI